MVGSISTFTVVARSRAEMPVVTLCLASTDTVKALSNGEVFSLTINGILSSSSLFPFIGMQINPRACLAIKLIASGVIFPAAIIMSPSFSRPSSSTTMRNLPPLRFSIASGMVASAISRASKLSFSLLCSAREVNISVVDLNP